MSLIDRSWTPAAALLAACTLAACVDKTPPTPVTKSAEATTADTPASSQVLGVVPAGPTPEAPATKSAAKSDVSKSQQSNAMPMPGQANDHSLPIPKPKADAKPAKPAS